MVQIRLPSEGYSLVFVNRICHVEGASWHYRNFQLYSVAWSLS